MERPNLVERPNLAVVLGIAAVVGILWQAPPHVYSNVSRYYEGVVGPAVPVTPDPVQQQKVPGLRTANPSPRPVVSEAGLHVSILGDASTGPVIGGTSDQKREAPSAMMVLPKQQ
jgi:hypothetical protein